VPTFTYDPRVPPTAPLLRRYRSLTRVPVVGPVLGARAFSVGVWFAAPYFRTVRPWFTELEAGRGVVTMRNRWGVHNHLGTVHAIASCNLAEVAAGITTEVTVPATHRWIPKGMTVSYLAVARTRVTATATVQDLADLAADESREVVVPVDLATADGTVYVHADITMWVSPRPGRVHRDDGAALDDEVDHRAGRGETHMVMSAWT
jgi:acyl-coenzyme A thioesterase PaaI-like protein